MNKRTKGILLLILSAFFFACMNMFVKLSGEELPVFQKVFFRNAMAAIIAFIVLLKNKAPLKPSVKGSLPFLILRTLFGLMGVVCNYYALETLVLSDASILNKMSPFFAVLFSFIFIKERPRLYQWLILGGALFGALFVIKPSFANAAFVTPKLLGNIMATGFPSLLRQALNSITTVMLNTCCAVYGDAAVAAMSIVSRIIFFSFSIALGIGQGFQPVSAFSYGAKQYSRLRKGFLFAVFACEGVIVITTAILILFSNDLIALFRDDPTVIEIGTRALILQALATLVLPPCMVVEMLFQSTGRRLGASLLSLLRNGLFFIPTLWILSNVRGLAGIQEAQPLSLLLSVPVFVIFAAVFFRKLPEEDGTPV